MSSSPINVGIFIFPDVEVLDFAGPFEVFSRTRTQPGPESRRSEETAPFRVFTFAKQAGSLMATGGLEVVARYGFEDMPAADILLIPGGFGSRALLEDIEFLDWLRDRAPRVKQLCSVCTGSLLLAKAGLLKGCKATTHWGALDLLESIDREVEVLRDQRVVVDRVVSSAGVAAGIDMAFYLVEEYCGKEVADETAQYIEYKRTPVHR
ncbi:MAG: DJ-1/PfpI family protein [Planctomycetota bacterium]|jgi:transcriptional regulator GlxA family with amidase domain